MGGVWSTKCSAIGDVAAEAADAIILNRGYHSLERQDQTLAVVRAQLNATLARLAMRVRPATRIIYRGTHASMYNCELYADPIGVTAGGRVHPVAYALRIHRSNLNAWHSWRNVYPHHRLDQDLMAQLGVPYLNSFVATSLRPGGRLRRDDCLHFCLPGPVDDWTRWLLAFLT